MLDLNYVRENLESVRAALDKRGMPTGVLNDFAREDAERRQQIKLSYGGPNLSRYSVEFTNPLTIVRKSDGLFFK